MMTFSIITISFNSEKTIERTIKSVLAQTYKDYEYIIVDGASKDGTLDIVKKYEPLFEGRMKWKSEPDKGIYNAMNKGIQRATGDIIGIVNSDDWLETDALSNVYSSFINNNRDLNTLYCGGIIFHSLSGVKSHLDVNLDKLYKQSKYYRMAGIRHPATFVPHEVYNKIGWFDENIKIAADSDFIVRCVYGNIKFIKIEKYLSNMSEGGVSTQSGIFKALKRDRMIVLKKNGVSGLYYHYLMITWTVEKLIKNFLIKARLFKTT